MKKTLLATTALGMFAAGSAFAAGPTVTLGGYADFQLGIASQESLYEEQNLAAGTESDYTRAEHTRTDTELHVNVDGKADNGLGYGAYMELEADVNADDSTNAANNNVERGYIYVESGFGRVEAGPTGDAGDALRIDASTFARATGGIAGDFYKYIDLSNNGPIGAGAGDFYILPGLPTAVGLPGEAAVGRAVSDNHNARATANKISYYSPRIQGFQGGVSYTPDQQERGTQTGFSGESTAGIEDVWNLGLNYEGQVQSIGVNASLTGEFGDTEDNGTTATTSDDLAAYALGLNLSYAGFTVGGSYGTADEFSQTETQNQEITYWTLGAAYEFGPAAFSLTYLDSEVENAGSSGGTRRDNEFSNISLGADYQLAPGLVPYVEVSFFDTDDNITDTATTTNNEGSVVILGTELSF